MCAADEILCDIIEGLMFIVILSHSSPWCLFFISEEQDMTFKTRPDMTLLRKRYMRDHNRQTPFYVGINKSISTVA